MMVLFYPQSNSVELCLGLFIIKRGVEEERGHVPATLRCGSTNL